MTQRLGTVAALIALGVVATGSLMQAQLDAARTAGPAERSAVLFVVRLSSEPLIGVVASGGGRPPAAIVIPPAVTLTIPGQGDANARVAASLPGPPAVAAISNLLGVWIPHYALTDASHLGAAIERSGGVELLGSSRGGAAAVEAVDSATGGAARQEALVELLDGVAWGPGDLTTSDDARASALTLDGGAGAEVRPLPVSRADGGLLQVDERATAAAAADGLGGSGSVPVPVVVLNGSGVPGAGQAAAAALIPAGFRVVASGNAASFRHAVTLVAASGPGDRAEAERAREALGVGTVSVAGSPSGLAAVTIVLGKDFEPDEGGMGLG